MTSVVADTHAVVWYVETSSRLSPAALTAIQSAIQSGNFVYISSVCLVEVAYLVEKSRLPHDMFDRIVGLLRQPSSGLVELPFTVAMAETMRLIPAAIVSDMPDRMIAATALHYNLPLVTRDSRIHAAPLATIW